MRLLRRLKEFFTVGIWNRELRSSPVPVRAVFYLLRAVALVVRGLTSHRLSVWASSLTYFTLISVVPFLALIVGVGARLGVPGKIVDRFVADIPDQYVSLVTDAAQAFENIDFRTVGLVSLVLLVYAAVKVLLRIESAFNEVWGVERTRGTLRRLGIYAAVVIFAPALLFAGMVLTATILSSDFMLWVMKWSWARSFQTLVVRFLPLLSTWIALTLLYWLVPYTKVKLRAALVGALLGAFLSQVAQQIFFQAGIGLARLGVVYGAFAAIPIFLAWVYFNWVLIMLGVEITYGAQHAREWFRGGEEEEPETGPRAQDIALRVALWLGTTPGGHDVDAIASALGVPARLVNRLLGILADEGVLATEPESEIYRLAREPGDILAEAVLTPFRAESDLSGVGPDEPAAIPSVVRALRERARAPYQITLADLYREAGPGGR